jgi:hypothetical protein
MDAGGIWVLVGIALGLLATVGVAVLVVVRRRKMGATAGEEMTGDQWLTMGVVFMGAGVALMASIGPHMAFMLAIGVVYMAIGLRVKSQEPK